MDLPVRKDLRLKGYDYSSGGLYFLTICVKDKHEMLGQVVGAIINRPCYPTNRLLCTDNSPLHTDNRPDYSFPSPLSNGRSVIAPTKTPYVELSQYGIIADKAINEISAHYKNVSVDRYVIMPNHIHLILEIQNNETDGQTCGQADGRLIIAPTVSTIVKQLKQSVSKQLGFSLWQKSFYDHIIRDEQDYSRVAEYIENNPLKWTEDIYFRQG